MANLRFVAYARTTNSYKLMSECDEKIEIRLRKLSQPPQSSGPCTLVYTRFHYIRLCTFENATVSTEKLLQTIGLSICVHMSTLHFLLCTQECMWHYSVHSTEFFTSPFLKKLFDFVWSSCTHKQKEVHYHMGKQNEWGEQI